MQENHQNREYKVDYFNPVGTLIMMLVITISITRPLSGDGFWKLFGQRWFYTPFMGTFAAIGFLFMLVEAVTTMLDKYYRWERGFVRRFVLQLGLAWIGPTIIIAGASWLYFYKLHVSTMLSMYNWTMFTLLAGITGFINCVYIVYYFYHFIRHLSVMESLKAQQGQEAERKSYFVVPDGRGETKIPITAIAYIFRDADNVILRTLSGLNYLLDQSLDEIEKAWDPAQLFRVNRSYIISYAAYVSWKRYNGKRILLLLAPPSDNPVIVSRDKVALIREWIKNDPSIFLLKSEKNEAASVSEEL